MMIFTTYPSSFSGLYTVSYFGPSIFQYYSNAFRLTQVRPFLCFRNGRRHARVFMH